MWKVFVLLALVAGLSIVYCDDSLNDDCQYDGLRTVDNSDESESSSSSSTSLYSSSSSSSSSGKSARSSSSSSKSLSSASESSSSKTTSKNRRIDDSDDDSTLSYKCGANEVFSNCTNGGCDARNCSQAGKSVPCVKLDPKSCKKGCVCQPGYLRASSGTCVLRNQCNEGCGDDPNAHPGCGVNCGKTCATYKVKNPICPLICNLNGCDCNEGYVLDPAVNKCVLPEDCTPVCGVNEIASTCANGGCSPFTCSDVGNPVKCVRPIKCTKGCVCQNDFVRNDNGTCVPQGDCPAVGCNGDPNAQSGCGVNCGKTCSTYKIKNPVCPAICALNGCDCKDGYVFDANLNKCVLPKDCTPICGLNERFDSCAGFGCGRWNCNQLGRPQVCRDPKPGGCKNGCTCVKGYLRTDNGTCVPQDQCPGANGCNGDPNAEPGCGINCGRTCSSYKIKNVGCPDVCVVNGCDCKQGYVFDDKVKKCVLPEQCTEAVGCNGDPNAQSGCGVNCGKTCSTYKIKNPVCPAICALNGCDCKDGYVFDANLNKCVLPKDCTPICGLNEKFDSCAGFGCGRWNCSQLGQPELCRDPVPGGCKNGCTCVNGYLRADNGTCVPQDQCPGANDASSNDASRSGSADVDATMQASSDINSGAQASSTSNSSTDSGCNGDQNAEPGCGVNCGRTCSTYKLKNVACPAICALNGCDCKQGYVFDDNVKKCVLPEQCSEAPSDQCPGQNEFFDTCISGCGNQTCDSIGKIINCPLQPAVCRTGCRCKPGFYRNPQNVCVTESECPSPACPEGEVYSRCPTVKCEGDYCPKTRDSPLTCPVGIVCDQPRCVCGFNRKRDLKTGKCISISGCPPFKCDGPNESYQSCPATCPGDNCSDYIYSTKCPPFRIGIVVPCQPQCKCNSGYYRSPDGVCILGPECGPKQNSSSPIFPLATDAPATSTDAPVTSTDALATCTDAPVTYTDAPVTYTDAPVTYTDAPVTATDAPVTSIDAPADTTTMATTTDNSGDAIDAQAGLTELQAGVTSFNGKFLYDRIKAGNGENIIASPFSVFTPLAQLALYADGESLKQLTTVLNVTSKNDIRVAFPLLVSSFDGQTGVNFSMAAKVYCNKDYPLSDGFKKDTVDVIHAESQELDFNLAAAAADIINQWVANKTNNRITDLIQSSDLSSLTRIVLANAIYFKGVWLKSFDTKNTKDADFYLSDGTTKKTKLMYQESQFDYGEVPDLSLKALKMYYTNKNFSMVFVLPNEKDGVLKTAESLQDSANFDRVLGSLRSQKVQVYIPPFEINTETDLSDILQEEGVTDIFKPDGSGLSGMLKNPQSIYVSKAIQKAFIKVNEEGSEAAAANGVIVTTRSMPLPPADPVVFRADHPFLFYIRAKDATLFCGSFVQ